MKSMLMSVMVFICAVAALQGQSAEDQTKYTREKYSFKRVNTSPADWNMGIFLPQFPDFLAGEASEREIKEKELARYGLPPETFAQLDRNGDRVLDKGELAEVVTLKDWEKFFLSQSRFVSLDQEKPFGVITKSEMDEDPLQGMACVYEQGESLVEQRCKKIADYKAKLKELQQLGYSDLFSAQCVIDTDDIKKLPKESLCELSGENPWTKVYIGARSGSNVEKKVDLGNYNLLLLQDHEEETSVLPYLALVSFVGLVAAVVSLFGPIFR